MPYARRKSPPPPPPPPPLEGLAEEVEVPPPRAGWSQAGGVPSSARSEPRSSSAAASPRRARAMSTSASRAQRPPPPPPLPELAILTARLAEEPALTGSQVGTQTAARMSHRLSRPRYLIRGCHLPTGETLLSAGPAPCCRGQVMGAVAAARGQQRSHHGRINLPVQECHLAPALPQDGGTAEWWSFTDHHRVLTITAEVGYRAAGKVATIRPGRRVRRGFPL